MKLRFVVVAILCASLLFLANTNIAHAQWPAINAGYAVTTDWHGEDAPIGVPVTATAGTTDMKVKKVEFKWLDPDGDVVWDVWTDVFGPYETPDVPPGVPQEVVDWANENPGVNVSYGQNTQALDELGDWGVQAVFHNPGKIKGKNSDMVKIRASSIYVVPEVPLGTIAIILSMFGALSIFAMKRRHSHTKMPS